MNYTEIKNAALAYSDRQDSTAVVANMDNFLRVVEARMNRLLTIDDLSIRYQFPAPNPADGRYNLPADFSALQDISIIAVADTTQRTTLLLINPEQMNNATSVGNNPAGSKRFYNIIAGQLVIQPVIDDTSILEIVYYGKLLPLTSIVINNWIATNNPDVYIFGLMTEINSFMKDGVTADAWNARFVQAISEISSADDQLVYSGPPLITRAG